MPGSQSLSKPQVFTYDMADANLTGFASNATGASWTLARTSATDGLAHQVSVRNDSANDKSSINITFVGTDPDGNTLSETIAGPTGSATVETAGYFYTLTSVTPASTWGADTADIGWVDEISSQTIVTNHLAEDTVVINVDVTGTANFSVQQTFDNVLDASLYTAPAQQVQWVSIAASQTADNQWYADGGATAVRILVNSYSSGAELSVNVNATYISASAASGGGGDVNLTEIGGTAVSNTTPGVLDVNVLSGGGSNASVGTVAAAVPTSATYAGFRSSAGNLTAGQLMADGSLQATPITVRATPSDAISNSGVLARMQDTSGAFAYLGTIPIQFNGTTWDLPRGDATNGLLVNLGANNDVTISGTAAVTQSGTWNVGTVTTVTTVGTLTGTTSLTPGTAAANLGKAEDAAHASGDTGVAIWGVRRDTAATFGADGDYTPLRVDQFGDQIVQVADSTGLPLTYLPPGLAAASASNPVVAARSTSLNNGQVAATATAGTLLAQNTNRMSVTFINFGANTVYIGEATVTAANGLPLIAGASYTSESSALFQVICDTGLTSTVAYIEEVA